MEEFKSGWREIANNDVEVHVTNLDRSRIVDVRDDVVYLNRDYVERMSPESVRELGRVTASIVTDTPYEPSERYIKEVLRLADRDRE